MQKMKFSDISWTQVLKACIVSVVVTIKYHYCLYQLLWEKKSYNQIELFNDDVWAKVQVYSISLIFKMWSKPHYRSSSFQKDMQDNLKNVAVPGTGIPLHLFCYHWFLCLLFILILNPLLSFIGAIHKSWIETDNLNDFLINTSIYYGNHLLHPNDWFSFWRLNCRLVSYHSMLLHGPGYSMENKWTFLTHGKDLGVPVSPFYTDIESIVCKNVNIEGGMGIHFFKNASFGGDWILQARMRNAAWLNRLLPPNSPLSTMRVITTSSWSLQQHERSKASASGDSPTADNDTNPTAASATASVSASASASADSVSISQPLDAEPTASLRTPPTARSGRTGSPQSNNTWTDVGAEKLTSPSANTHSVKPSTSKYAIEEDHTDKDVNSSKSAQDLSAGGYLANAKKYIKPLSAVLRLGRSNANTDHSAVLFNVDIKSGAIGVGTTNTHWYQLGVDKIVSCPWLCADSFTSHPDEPHPIVTGHTVPGMQEAVDMVIKAHMTMMKDVPIVGWDVAFSDQGIFLLEVNLSCNFFKGRFDVPEYISFVDSYFRMLSSVESSH